MDIQDKVTSICPTTAKTKTEALDAVAAYDNTHSEKERVMENYAAHWPYMLRGVPLHPALHECMRRVLRKNHEYIMIPMGPFTRSCTPYPVSTETEPSYTASQCVELPAFCPLIECVGVYHPSSEYMVALIEVETQSSVKDLPCGTKSRQRAYQISSPRVEKHKSNGLGYHTLGSSKISRIVNLFNKLKKPIAGKERLDLVFLTVRNEAVKNVASWELQGKTNEAQNMLKELGMHALLRLHRNNLSMLTEKEVEVVQKYQAAKQEQDDSVDYRNKYDVVHITEVDELICANREGYDQGYQWFDAFTSLPPLIQEHVAVLNMCEVKTLTPGIGARFDSGYMVLIPREERVRGNTTNPNMQEV